MNRKLKTALKPQKPFEEWAEENSVELTEHVPTKRQYFKRWIRQKRVIAGLSSAMAVCLIFAILLPVLLLNKPDTGNPPKTYTSQDSVSERIEIEELYQVENLLLFDINQVIDLSRIKKDIAYDDETLILSYAIQDGLIMTGDEVNAFYINYRIRLYEHYEFTGYLKFSNLQDNFLIGETKINYEIVEEGRNDKKAYIQFTYNGYDYFLEANGFEGVTDITEETLKILLNDLLS